jgi:hypothetical protein
LKFSAYTSAFNLPEFVLYVIEYCPPALATA